MLRDYTRFVIDEAWPLQRKGYRPRWSSEEGLPAFQERPVSFEPQPNLKRPYTTLPSDSSTPSSKDSKCPPLQRDVRASQLSCGSRSR